MMSKRRALIENATAGRYTVCFYNGNTLLQTVTNVPRGGTAVYTGTTPTTSNVGWEFTGWNPSPTKIKEDTICYAQFVDPYECKEITDTWVEIFASIDNGTYLDKYKIGNYKPLDLGTEGIIAMQIVAFNKDIKPDGGFASITWISRELLSTSCAMNRRLSGASGARTVGTGSIGGWKYSSMRSWMRDTVKPRIPAEVSSRITAVTKTSFINNSDETTTIDDVTIDDVWIPSEKEIFGGTSRESQGVYYCSVFNSATRRKKQKVNGTSVDYWWLRSAGSNLTHYEMVSTSGTIFSYHSEYGFGVALGFCT